MSRLRSKCSDASRESGLRARVPLSESERELIRREERLAWGYGRSALVGLGFEGIADYDRIMQEHLDIYEKTFELDLAGVTDVELAAAP